MTYWHIYPKGDLKEHDTDDSPTCWCRPETNENGLVVHNSLDRREIYEHSIN